MLKSQRIKKINMLESWDWNLWLNLHGRVLLSLTGLANLKLCCRNSGHSHREMIYSLPSKILCWEMGDLAISQPANSSLVCYKEFVCLTQAWTLLDESQELCLPSWVTMLTSISGVTSRQNSSLEANGQSTDCLIAVQFFYPSEQGAYRKSDGWEWPPVHVGLQSKSRDCPGEVSASLGHSDSLTM